MVSHSTDDSPCFCGHWRNTRRRRGTGSGLGRCYGQREAAAIVRSSLDLSLGAARFVTNPTFQEGLNEEVPLTRKCPPEGFDESHLMETEDETQVTAGFIEIFQSQSLEVAQLKTIYGVER